MNCLVILADGSHVAYPWLEELPATGERLYLYDTSDPYADKEIAYRVLNVTQHPATKNTIQIAIITVEKESL